MNKKVLGIVGLIILLIIGAFAYLLASPADKAAMDEMRAEKVQTDAVTTSPSSDTQQPEAVPGVYANYSSTIIAQTKGVKVLFFHAPWCPQCRALEADIVQQGVPDNTTVIKVDYDTNQSLRQKYGVTLQTTLVRIDDQGNLVKKLVAYDDPSVRSVKAVLQ